VVQECIENQQSKKEEEEKPVKKIVIVTNKPEPDYGLFGLLNTLFPECEIHVVPRRVETFRDCVAGCCSDHFKGHTIREEYDGKYFNYR
jgi:hypothetical protein